MSETFQKNCEDLKKTFAPLSAEGRYKVLIEWGQKLAVYPESEKIPRYLVPGCQSQLYLKPTLKNGQIFFEAASDALISAGLAALLIAVYSGESPETILTFPPTFLTELGIQSSLSYHRSNGLASIYLKMKFYAVEFLSRSPI